MKKYGDSAVILIGMTGCGKTTVGRLAAKKLGYDFVDLDCAVTDGAGMTAREVFDRYGEEKWRMLECETLKSILDAPRQRGVIIASGGGAVTYEETRRLIREAFTVHIKRSPDRIMMNKNVMSRPPVNGSRENYMRLFSERKAIYKELADTSIYNSHAIASSKKLAAVITGHRSTSQTK